MHMHTIIKYNLIIFVFLIIFIILSSKILILDQYNINTISSTSKTILMQKQNNEVNISGFLAAGLIAFLFYV